MVMFPDTKLGCVMMSRRIGMLCFTPGKGKGLSHVASPNYPARPCLLQLAPPTRPRLLQLAPPTQTTLYAVVVQCPSHGLQG